MNREGNERVMSEAVGVLSGVVIHEVENEIIVYNPLTRKYTRIGKLAHVVLSFIIDEGYVTGDDILFNLCKKYQFDKMQLQKLLSTFLTEMVAFKVLYYQTEGEQLSTVEQRSRIFPLLKLFRSRRFNNVPSTSVGVLPDIKLTTWLTLFLIIMIFGALLFITTIVMKQFVVTFNYWYVIIPAIVLHLFGHEMVHATLSRKFGGNIREAGIGLLYFILPVAYVDLTDNYLLQKKKRGIIALGGPAFDALFMMIILMLSWITSGVISETFLMISYLQFSMLIFNCNLLLPSDLLRFIECWFGLLHLRNHSLQFVKHIIIRRNAPTYLGQLSTPRKIVYTLYAVLSGSYIALIVILIFQFYSAIIFT
jgi:putative peptide zinc metalloprotease protein